MGEQVKQSRTSTGKKRSGIAAFALLCAIAVLVCLTAISFVNNMKAKAELDAQYSALEDENRALKMEEELLRTMLDYSQSKEYLIQLARERYGFVRPGEIVFDINQTTPDE